MIAGMIPISPPIIEGNSGPRKAADSTYGIDKHNPPKIANFQAPNPSLKDLFSPQNLQSNTTMNKGMIAPTIPCIIAILKPISVRNSFHEVTCRRELTLSIFPSPRPVFNPIQIGAPDAPNETVWL